MNKDQSRQWFTSDLHFKHQRICSFTNRPWKQEENDEKLIELWNAQVKPGDIVWHLGDFAFVNNNDVGMEYLNNLLDRLNGQKRFILGNHDPSKLFKEIHRARNDVVSVERLKEVWIGEKPNKVMLVMCHYPMTSWNRSHHGSIQIHGHEHGRIHNFGKSIDVGLDGAFERLGEWRFWTEEDIIAYANKLDIHDPSLRKNHVDRRDYY